MSHVSVPSSHLAWIYHALFLPHGNTTKRNRHSANEDGQRDIGLHSSSNSELSIVVIYYLMEWSL